MASLGKDSGTGIAAHELGSCETPQLRTHISGALCMCVNFCRMRNRTTGGTSQRDRDLPYLGEATVQRLQVCLDIPGSSYALKHSRSYWKKGRSVENEALKFLAGTRGGSVTTPSL
jgi:hypothetical protein